MADAQYGREALQQYLDQHQHQHQHQLQHQLGALTPSSVGHGFAGGEECEYGHAPAMAMAMTTTDESGHGRVLSNDDDDWAGRQGEPSPGSLAAPHSRARRPEAAPAPGLEETGNARDASYASYPGQCIDPSASESQYL